jgi:hypothetical protein
MAIILAPAFPPSWEGVRRPWVQDPAPGVFRRPAARPRAAGRDALALMPLLGPRRSRRRDLAAKLSSEKQLTATNPSAAGAEAPSDLSQIAHPTHYEATIPRSNAATRSANQPWMKGYVVVSDDLRHSDVTTSSGRFRLGRLGRGYVHDRGLARAVRIEDATDRRQARQCSVREVLLRGRAASAAKRESVVWDVRPRPSAPGRAARWCR